MSDVLGGMPKGLFPDLPAPGKEAGAAKKPGYARSVRLAVFLMLHPPVDRYAGSRV